MISSLVFVVVIAKASRTGNCKRLNSNGISVGIIGIRGNRTSSPLNFPVKIVASIAFHCVIIFLTESLVPLKSWWIYVSKKYAMGTPIQCKERAVACLQLEITLLIQEFSRND
ncbi:hypothetical protein TNCV_2820931 [Trichonephila clavipes]|nr:hypothetical protein TNCV_2820931 [Trichonephila clavipes]